MGGLPKRRRQDLKFLFGLVLGFFLATAITSFSDRISSPPPLDESLVIVQHYFQEIYQNLHRLQVVTSNPDGSRQGKKGDQLQLQTGGNIYHCENSDSSTTWRCVQLTDTP